MRPIRAQAQRQHGDQGEQAQQDRGYAGNGWVGPLPLGFQAQMGTGLLKRHLDRPAHHDPVQDLLRGGVQIGTEERGIRQFPLRVPYQDQANGDGGHARGIPQRGAGEDPEPFTLAPVPLHGRLLPGRVGAGGPDFQALLTFPLGGLAPALARRRRDGGGIERGIQAQPQDRVT